MYFLNKTQSYSVTGTDIYGNRKILDENMSILLPKIVYPVTKIGLSCYYMSIMLPKKVSPVTLLLLLCILYVACVYMPFGRSLNSHNVGRHHSFM